MFRYPGFRIPIVSLCMVMTGCAALHEKPATPPARIIDTACSWVGPITASAADTLETKRQILAHDLAVAKNCPAAAR